MKYNYYGLFVLSGTYIFLMAMSTILNALWFMILMRVLAIAVPLLLARFMPLCRMSVVDYDISFRPRPLLETIWLFPLFVGLVAGLSALTTLIANKFGVVSGTNLGDNIWLAILTSAVLPALTEELFCRYIFLPRLSAFSKSGAVFASAIFFSLMHGNVLQIPYALIAGIFLGALTVASGSVLPAIFFHLFNNILSILYTFFANTRFPTVFLYAILGGLVITAVCAVIFRRKLWERLKETFACNGDTGKTIAGLFTTPVVVFIFVFASLAVVNLMG